MILKNMSIDGSKVSHAVTVMNKNLTGTEIVGLEVFYLELALNTIVVRQGIQTLAGFRTRYDV